MRCDKIDEDSDIDIEVPGDEFVPITKLKRMACLAHTVPLVCKDICKINVLSSLLEKATNVVKAVRLSGDTGTGQA